MLVTKNKKTAVVALACFLTCYSRATTVTVIVTPAGIALASDSSRSTHMGDFSPIGKNTTQKFVRIQNHIIIASVGTSDITTTTLQEGTVTRYSFLEWIKKIEQSLPPSVSVDDFANVIQTQSAATFDGFDKVINSGFIKRKKELENCRTFIQYIIAGYDSHTAKVYAVQFYIDWEQKKLVGPRLVSLYPSSETSGNYVFYSFGFTEALDDVNNPGSYAYKMISARCPAFRTLEARHDITIKQSIAVAKQFVRVEEDIAPTEVFGNVVAVGVLAGGNFIDGGDAKCGEILPKAPVTKHQQKH